MSEPPLPYGRHTIEDDDVAAVVRVLRGERLTTGPAVDAFERAFAEAVGAGHAVALSSGTAALHLSALALGLGPGDKVIVPTVTFPATANAARFVGADVVFADVDPDSGLMGARHLRAALAAAGGAKAVFPVHLNGQCADIEALAVVAAEHGLAVVEDACHALGGRYRAGDGEWIAIGACVHARMAMFSFHPVKTIAMGEGGALTTNDETLARMLREMRSHSMVRDASRFRAPDQAFGGDGEANPWYYEMQGLGFNYRASDIHCALGSSQLAKLGRFVERRRLLAAAYGRLLAPLAPAVRPIARTQSCDAAWHLYVVLVDFPALGSDRGAVMRRLSDAGIGTQVHYLPVHRQPYYRDLYGAQTLPGADAYYTRALTLPLFPAMQEADVARVVAALGKALGLDPGTAPKRR